MYLTRTSGPLTALESGTLTKSVILSRTSSGYDVQYLPRISGDYSVHVELDGKAVEGTPFTQAIVAGAINAR